MADTESAPMETQNSHENSISEEQNTEKTSKESRLMITKIVNENFKSYAGIQELGPFHKVTFQTTTTWFFCHKTYGFFVFFHRVFLRSLGQMVVVNLMLLMLCCLCLDIAQKWFEQRRFLNWSTTRPLIPMLLLAQCLYTFKRSSIW